MATIKYISLDNLTLYDQLIKNYISVEDAKQIKTVMLGDNGWTLNFYRESEPISNEAVPAYSLALPKTNLDPCMKRVMDALQGNIAVFNNNGSVTDGGVALSDLVTETEAQEMIATAIEAATHLRKQIVEDISTVTNPSDNTIYLVYVEGSDGEDKYKEYTLIDGTMTLIGTTSTDLQDYLTKAQIEALIANAKTDILADAATDAQTRADKALADAKTYTDQEIVKLDTKFDAIGDRIDAVEGDIVTINSTLSQHGDRITTLENSATGMTVATEAEIKALFGIVESSGS